MMMLGRGWLKETEMVEGEEDEAERQGEEEERNGRKSGQQFPIKFGRLWRSSRH